MPLISIRLAAGRSDDQLAQLVEAVSAATSHTLAIPVERIGVHLFELEPNRVARGGRLASEASP
jgi:4-oxalocrotonate tautomerase family enzyme